MYLQLLKDLGAFVESKATESRPHGGDSEEAQVQAYMEVITFIRTKVKERGLQDQDVGLHDLPETGSMSE